ncbi:MAG: diguanylate cyclase [Defluviitaleaceae bacterium]|nr:diguanylate cyclase [Defluviitaleaceae bacterium]
MNKMEMQGFIDGLIEQNVEFAMLLMDVDFMSKINQDYGRDAGDAVLHLLENQADAMFLATCTTFREVDHFEIILPGYGKETAFLAAENLRKAIADVVWDFTCADGVPLRQTVSIGVATYPEDGSRAADIFRRANGAMMRAKKAGRNQVALAREEKLAPKTSHYTQTQLEQLSELSEKIGVGEAALLREALDELLRKYDTD